MTTNRTSEAVEQLQAMMKNQSFFPPVDTKLKAITDKYNRYENVLKWLLHESGYKEGRIPGDELDMIEKALLYDPLADA